MEYSNKPSKKFKEAFLKLKNIPTIITFHSFGDLDACSSAIALKEFLGQKTIIAVQDTINSQAKIVLKDYYKKFLKFEQARKIYKNAKIILVDCNHKSLLRHEINEVDFLIDHHAIGKDSLKVKHSFVWPEASSTAELIAKLIKPNPRTAKLLIMGILADSSFLTHANAETFYIMYKLLKENNLDFEKILTDMDIIESSKKRVEVLEAIKNIKIVESKGYVCAFGIVKEYQAIIAENLIRIGADVAFVASNKEDCVICARMHKRNLFKVDLISIVEEIGKIIKGEGGGHPLAAAVSGKEKKKCQIALEKAKELFFSQLK
ncbi:MAG: DHH family phosphoesterase [Candidatus Anstonellaceae archaeon]